MLYIATSPEHPRMTPQALNNLLLQIAQEHLFVETLETRYGDRLDFYDASVWGIKAALQAAFEAGRQAAITETATTLKP
jgi:hypothetical protein